MNAAQVTLGLLVSARDSEREALVRPHSYISSPNHENYKYKVSE
jgi:hypothetical protein